MIIQFNIPSGDRDKTELLALGMTCAGATAVAINGDLLDVSFDSEPSQGTQDAFQAKLDAYVLHGTHVKINRYLCVPDMYEPPIHLDFATAPNHELQKKVTQVWQGDIQEIIYYAEADPNTGAHTDPIVKRTFDITYNAMSISVTETIAWYLENGDLHPTTKIMERVYVGQRWLDWLQDKRGQIIAWLRYNVAVAMIMSLCNPTDGWTVSDVMAAGGEFFHDHGPLISTYIAGYDQAFPEAVAADTRFWLDRDVAGRDPGFTIRELFQEQLVYT